jgi:hypothetical protein
MDLEEDAVEARLYVVRQVMAMTSMAAGLEGVEGNW